MHKHTLLLSIFLILISTSFAFYEGNSKVVKLTAANFNDLVIKGKELWFVEFYAPWCGHCQHLTPEWEKLAGALEGIIKVGAVDMTTDQAAGSAYGIRGFPTIKFFGADKRSPVDYEGQRAANDFVNFGLDQARKAVESRTRGGSGGGNQYQQGGHQQQHQGGGGATSDKDVVILTDANFESEVMESEDLVLVEFYAPWCGHCKTLEPEWSKAATELKGQVKICKLDATRESATAQRFGVNAYPQIKLFPSGKKSDSQVEDYEGARDASSIANWAMEKKAQYKPASKVEQLTNQELFDNYCTNLRGVCFIAFLPHIYDSSASERNDYIQIFKDLAQSNRANPVTFIWAQGGDYYDVEESLGLGSGYPSLVAMSVGKKKYAPFSGSFNVKNIDTWVKTLIAGKQPLFDLRTIPTIKTRQAWDGNDAKPASNGDDL